MNQLIYSDTNQINNEKQKLTAAVPYAQSVYDAFSELGVILTIDQIQVLSQSINVYDNDQTLTSRINTIITDYLINKAGSTTFNGVPINTNKLRELIAVPDISGLVEIVKTFSPGGVGSGRVEPAWLTLQNGVVSKVANSDDLINKAYSYYTKTTKGDNMLAKLSAIKTALQDWEDYGRQIGFLGAFNPAVKEMKGIKMENNKYVVDHFFIYSKEQP